MKAAILGGTRGMGRALAQELIVGQGADENLRLVGQTSKQSYSSLCLRDVRRHVPHAKLPLEDLVGELWTSSVPSWRGLPLVVAVVGGLVVVVVLGSSRRCRLRGHDEVAGSAPVA